MRQMTLGAVAAMTIALMGWGAVPAFAADADPSMHQIYQAAEAGHLDQAQSMIDQVLRDHPRSAKAHYVQAELFAREGKIASARTELGRAEELEPGLPFAKPASVQALRSELAVGGGGTLRHESGDPALGLGAQSRGGGVPWGGVLLIGLVLGGIWMVLRRRQAASAYSTVLPPAAATGPYPASGPYPGGPYAGGGFGAPMGGGLGSGIAGGLASGLAVGAGVVAGEELAHHFLDGGRRESVVVPPEHERSDWRDPNTDMGGNDFGVNDASSWQDGGSSGGGGDDWT